MGQDKSLMVLGGRTLIERVRDTLTPLCDELILVTNTPDRYAHLALRPVPDAFPDSGSLGGLYSGLAAMSAEFAIAVACDMPFLNTDVLRYLLKLAAEADAVVPDLSGNVPRTSEVRGTSDKAKQLDLHPLHAVYRRTCLAPIEAQLRAGDLRMMGFYAQVNVRYVRRDELARYDPTLRSFFNVNTPDEWTQAERMAAKSVSRG